MSTRAVLLASLLSAGLACPFACTVLAAELIDTTPRTLAPATGGVVPADTAFAFNAIVAADGTITLAWEMPPAFYLYRKSLKLEHAGVDLLPALELPEAKIVTDEFFGESAVYFERLHALLPAGTLTAAPGSTLELQLSYQGCLQDIYCYPPQYRTVSITLPE